MGDIPIRNISHSSVPISNAQRGMSRVSPFTHKRVLRLFPLSRSRPSVAPLRLAVKCFSVFVLFLARLSVLSRCFGSALLLLHELSSPHHATDRSHHSRFYCYQKPKTRIICGQDQIVIILNKFSDSYTTKKGRKER